MSAPEDIRVLVPRVRRAVEGINADEQLTDDQIKDLVADAIADVILFTGGVFGKQLLVTDRDASGAPTEYETSDALTLSEGAVIAAQAALTAIYAQLHNLKTSETIRDEGQEWSYSLSASLLRDRVNQLKAERDRAIDALTAVTSSVGWVRLWHHRDHVYGHAHCLN